MEEAPRKFFRLKPGGEVRLRFGYIIRCDEVIKNDAGEVIELRCSYDPDTRSGTGTSDRKVKGTIHWVSCAQAMMPMCACTTACLPKPTRTAADDFHAVLNASRCRRSTQSSNRRCASRSGVPVQFERLGYFCADSEEHSAARRCSTGL